MIKIENNRVILDKVPGRIKKITGTRLASILGLDPWKSPFKTWCDMIGVYSDPFTETEYTKAGKIIEPMVIAYLDKRYYFGKGKLKDPFTWFGKSVEQLRYDHFPDSPILGGMWDARTEDCVYELKTSKRVEDWMQNGVFDAPMNYKLQGALYAYLLGFDKFVMALSITDDAILANPESFVPTPKNTLFRQYTLSNDLPFFAELVDQALEWRKQHIEKGISPDWSENDARDQTIVKSLTTQAIQVDEKDPVASLISQISSLQVEIDQLVEQARLNEKEEKVKAMKEELKNHMMSRMTANDKKINITGGRYKFEVSMTSGKSSFDEKKMRADGIDLEKYKKTGAPSYRLTVTAVDTAKA